MMNVDCNTTAVKITITEAEGKLRIGFAYNKRLVEKVKELPGAKFDGATKQWAVSKRYRKRVDAWLAEVAEAEKIAAEARADAVAAGHALFANLQAEGKRMSTEHVKLRTVGNDVRLEIRYDAKAHQILRNLGGRYVGKTETSKLCVWYVPIESAAALQEIMPQLERYAKAVSDKIEADRARWRAEREAREQARLERRRNRYPVYADRVPPTGVPVRLGGMMVVIESYGKTFRASEAFEECEADAFYPEMMGALGEWVCYAYYRRATSEEVAQLEQREAKDFLSTGPDR